MSVVAGCKLCAKGVGFEQDLTQREVGAKYGVGKSSVQRHRQHLGNSKEFEGYTLERMSIRAEDGSWYRYKKEVEVSRLDSSDIDRLFEQTIELRPTESLPHTEVLCMSDLQIGKAKQRGGGTPETLLRARQSIDTFAQRCAETQPERIILIDGGDSIENMWNTPEQLATNDLELTEQIRTVRRLFAHAIQRLAQVAPSVALVSVASNHGRVRSGFKANAGSVSDDYGLDINYALEEAFAAREGYKHVEFVRPVPWSETAVVEGSNTKLAVHHGHHSKGPTKHGEWWRGQDHGRMPGWDADILVMNHYHSFRVEHSGDARWIISASSSEPGSDWFSAVTGETSRQGMTAFSVSNRQWSNVAIL